MEKIYTYKFPYLPEYTTITKGMPVAFDEYGHVWPGAGLTVYRGSTYDEIQYDMKHVKAKNLDGDLILVAFDGGVTAFQGTCKGKSFQSNTVELVDRDKNPIVVRELIHMGEKRYIVVSREYLIPLEVTVDRTDSAITINILTGKYYHLPNDDDKYPHVDNLSSTRFAVVFERGLQLLTTFGTWQGAGSAAELIVAEPLQVHLRLNFHGVAGIDDNHYIITATGPVHNSTNPYPRVLSWLASIDGQEIVVQQHIILPFTFSDNWFAMDNIGSRHVIMVYADALTNGINAVMITYDNSTNTIAYGCNTVIQKGGSVLDYERMDITVLDNRKFVVTYVDGGAESLMMVTGARTDSNDLVVTSPAYIISRPRFNERYEGFWFDVASYNSEHFGIIEVKRVNGRRYTRFDLVATYPRVLGIAKKDGKGNLPKEHDHSHKENPIVSTVEVQLGGIFTLSGKRKLTPGRSIYTNSKGDLIESYPYGYVTRDFGTFYVVDKESNSILDRKNLVGMAVTSKKIKLKLD